MSFENPMTKILVATAVAAPLALVGCGSADETPEAAGSSAAATPSSKAKATSSAAASSSKEPTSSEKKPASTSARPAAEKQEEPAQAQGPAPAPAPANPDAPQGISPVAGAQASPEDQAGIEGLVRGLYETTTMRQFVRYMPDHSCQAILNADGGQYANMDFNQVPDIPMDQFKQLAQSAGQLPPDIAGFDWGAVGVQSVSDVKVAGDDASATVTVNTSNGPDSSLMRFKRENGNWTFCGDV